MRRKKKKKAENEQEDFSIELVKELDKNLDNLKQMLEEPNDLVIRKFVVRGTAHHCAVVYIDGLVNTELIHNNIVKNVQIVNERKELPSQPEKLFEEIYWEIISASAIEKAKTLDDISKSLLYGDTIFYLDGVDQVMIMDTKGWESRAIEEPVSESVIRGPRSGFVENIRTNMMLVRRNIQDPNLRFKTRYVGRRSKKVLVFAYLDGVAHPDLIKEVNRRLDSIDMDDAPESGYVEQWIEDSFLSPFPQLSNTERPDATASAITQGKVAIMLDGTPFVLLAPFTLGNAFQSPEDYYERWTIGSLLRALRYLAAFIAMFVPALYIALVSYHQGMIPSKLAFSIAATRDGVPFPPFVEAILMAITMELLREAGARLPTTIGQTIGIVGGLVIGDAAVKAGIVSPVMVVVVALTAIASFTLPAYSVAISFRLVRFVFMFAAALLGLYGIILIYIMINIHIVNLKSMGVPYSSPFAPTFFRDWMDLVFRAPIPLLTKRPEYLKPNDSISADKGDKK
ncbi:spore germination protein [Virgibacillus phasianinus]|uniref:Spore germination protein n=1 Tax=Virgibacillus phasianinus TaxID=2017483 RepID=A0A220TZI5_9BACI|nr:spore germination protein [Virgibacillus phasianinus]ASK61199.1 spore germination protein [Virgibacillus phasianinus]